MKNQKLQILLIIFLTFISYSNIFQNNFLGDDELWITNFKSIRSFDNIPELFMGHEFNDSRTRYRPVGSSFLSLYYHLFLNNPLGYHFIALLLHIINAVLIYLIVKHISRNKLTAFVAGLLFGIHPLTTETVSEIFTSINLGYSFSLASFFLYIKYKTSGLNREYILSVIFAIFGVLSYEISLVILPLIIFYDLCFKKIHLKLYLPYLIVISGYLFIRFYLLGISSRAAYLDNNFFLTMIVMFKVIYMYIGLLVLPIKLSINHTIAPGVQVWIDPFTNMDSLRHISLFNIDVLAGLSLVITLFIVAIRSYRKKPVVTFAIGWFFICYLPVSYIIPQDTIMQERYIYLGIFSFVFLFAYIYTYLYNFKYSKPSKKIIQKLLILFLIIVTAGFGARTYIRNKDWKDGVTMWSKLVKELPNDIVTNYMLGAIYSNRGEDDLALKSFNKVLRLQPYAINIYSPVAKIYLKKGQIKEAVVTYNSALAIVPNYNQAIAGLGSIKKLIASNSGIINSADGWLGQEFNGFLLFYPRAWQVTKGDTQISFQDQSKKFNLQFTFEAKNNQTPQEYFNNQSESFGNLKNEGTANIPNFNFSFIKIFDDSGVQKMQFFLFKGEKVIKILAYPSDSDQMKTLDDIIESIVILN